MLKEQKGENAMQSGVAGVFLSAHSAACGSFILRFVATYRIDYQKRWKKMAS